MYSLFILLASTTHTGSSLKFAVITSALTVLGGVLIVSFTEIIKSIFLEPIKALNEHVVTIIDRIIFYSASLTNYNEPNDATVDMRSHLRSASSQLRAKKGTLRLYRLWAFFKLVPSPGVIDSVAAELMGLSGGIPIKGHGDKLDLINYNRKSMERIAKALNVKLH